jgi:hypothetical protein
LQGFHLLFSFSDASPGIQKVSHLSNRVLLFEQDSIDRFSNADGVTDEEKVNINEHFDGLTERST